VDYKLSILHSPYPLASEGTWNANIIESPLDIRTYSLAGADGFSEPLGVGIRERGAGWGGSTLAKSDSSLFSLASALIRSASASADRLTYNISVSEYLLVIV